MRIILSLLVLLVAYSAMSAPLRRHPDAYLIFDGERVPEADVKVIVPAYSLPHEAQGCLSFAYAPGNLKWSDGTTERRESIVLPVLDQVIALKSEILAYHTEKLRVLALPEKYRTLVNGSWVEKTQAEKDLADLAEQTTQADTDNWVKIDKARFNVLLALINDLRLTNNMPKITKSAAKQLVKEELK